MHITLDKPNTIFINFSAIDSEEPAGKFVNNNIWYTEITNIILIIRGIFSLVEMGDIEIKITSINIISKGFIMFLTYNPDYLDIKNSYFKISISLVLVPLPSGTLAVYFSPFTLSNFHSGDIIEKSVFTELVLFNDNFNYVLA